MRRFALLVAIEALAAALVLASSATGASSFSCQATRIRSVPIPGFKSATEWAVKAGPFVGPVSLQYDAIGGRFRLHVGPYRDRATGLTQKIPWRVALGYSVGDSLVVRGERMTGPRRTFAQQFVRPREASTVTWYTFPTNISPPSTGCWRLTLRSGSVTGKLTVLVR